MWSMWHNLYHFAIAMASDVNTIVGLTAAACTTIAYVPQAIKTIRTRDTQSISMASYSLFALGSVVWTAYGIQTQNLPVIATNVVTSILSVIILFYKITGRKKNI